MVLDRLDGAGQQVVEPLHGHAGGLRLRGGLVHVPAADKPPGVPDLRAEVAALLQLGNNR